MGNFTVINESLVFKDGIPIVTFTLGKDKNKYLLYYVSDYDTSEKKLLVSLVLEDERGFDYLADIEEEERKKVIKIISELVNSDGDSKRKIRINFCKEKLSFEENVCQIANENDSLVVCSNILVVGEVINYLASNYEEGILLEEAIDKYQNYLIEKKERMEALQKREMMKGNASVFLLTLFAVLFLIVCCFMGVAMLFE